MPESGHPPRAATLRALGRALRHRNYRLFFTGQSISLIGSWMTRVATSWLIYRLTGSAWLLAVLGFAGQMPTFLLAPFAGVLVDRWNRHRVLMVTQVMAMIQSALLAVLALTGVITVAQVVILSVFQGLINAFDMPTRQALVVHMVDDRADLANAIALNSSMVNAARLIGPSIAGVVIAWAGEGVCFLVDAISYIAVIASVAALRLALPQPPVLRTHVLGELAEGIRYAMGSMPIRTLLAMLAVVSLVDMPHTVLMPIVASQVLHGGAHTLGFLMAATGLGALAGALYLASRRTVIGLGRVIHDEYGKRNLIDISALDNFIRTLSNKILKHKEEIILVERDYEGAEIVLVSYGAVARAAAMAAVQARKDGMPVGTLRLITAWPFPGEEIEKMARGAKHVIVLENNFGQIYPYIKAEAAHYAEVSFLPPRLVGEIQDPEDILRKIREVSK